MTPTKQNAGFTFAELMLALTITTIIALAVVTLSSALSSAHGQTQQVQESIQSARAALLSMGSALRRAKLVTSANESAVSLWVGDANGDGGINVDEIVTFEQNASDRTIVRRQIVFPEGISEVLLLTLNAVRDLSDVDSIGEVRGLLDAPLLDGYRTETVVATEVQSFTVSCDPAPPLTRLVGARVTIGSPDRQITVNSSTRIRADATDAVIFVEGQPRLDL